MRYASAEAFAQALGERLKRQAESEGVDIERLRKRVAFERYLARLFARDPAPWVLKGGYALEIRLGGRTRSTKDMDLNVPPPPIEDLLDELQEAAELDLGDFFAFRVGRPRKQQAGAPLGGWRFSVEVSLAGRPFTGFPLDVGLGDEPLGEVEWREGQADLGFAGLPLARVAVYPLADQFAEKLHAYTRPREVRTRVKDLVDLTTILEVLGDELPPAQEMRRTIKATFERYGTHPLPDPLPPPPEGWRGSFEATAGDLALETTDVRLAHEKLESYLAGLGFYFHGGEDTC